MANTCSDREKIWQQILDSSTAMQEVAEKNDWVALNELIESRQKLLKTFFSNDLAQHQQERLKQIRDDIQQILRQDAHTKKLSRRNKDILAKGLQTLSKGKQALKDYR